MKKLFLTLMISLTFILSINAIPIDSTAVDNFPKTDKVLSVIVQKATIVAEKTSDFVIEQSPLLLQEFYNWHIWSNILFILLSILLFLIGRYVPYIWLRPINKTDDIIFFNKSGDGDGAAAWGTFVLTSLISLSIFLKYIYKLIYILVAPKLYLIDYFINI